MIPIRPVAITGVDCLCAAGLNLSDCMDSLFSGRRNCSSPCLFSSTHPRPYPVFEIRDAIAGTNINDLINDRVNDQANAGEHNILRTSRLGLAAARQALENADLDRDNLKGKRVGVCMGTTVGSAMNNEAFYSHYREGNHPDMMPIKQFLNSNPAACISNDFQLSGPCQTVVNACSSGTDAIGVGASWIQSGLCDVVIAGGADELCRVTYNGFISLMIVDSSPCRPFDVNRAGLNLGEGAAVLILESEKSKRARNKKARAYVCGYGTACDAYHLTAPKPDGDGLRRAIADALAISGKTASDIAFVNAHGTGTPDNDRVESGVLHDMLPDVPFHSTKGYTGHTLGASGAIEAAFTVVCLEAEKTPANIGFTDPDPELPSSPQQHMESIKGDFAISESLAFGGNNSVLVIGKGALRT